MKKRGMSTIIASILIILIVLIAIAIVWVSIRTIFKQGSEQIELSKFTIDLNIDGVTIKNESVQVKVSRNPGEGDLKGVAFIVYYDEFNSLVFDKENASIQPLEIKTFILDHTGTVSKIAIAPLIESKSGKIIRGPILDIYFISGFGGLNGQEEANCTPKCQNKNCGSDQCGGQCGVCTEPTPVCIDGQCQEEEDNCDCSCAETTCEGTDCIGGCGETCPGTVSTNPSINPTCASVSCGPSPDGCVLICSECEPGYNCYQGTCQLVCTPNCIDFNLNCGPSPNGCGGQTQCGVCDTENGWWCDNGTCSNETCVQNCTDRECGPDPVCSESCGTCNISIGEWCSDQGICLEEQYINNGTVFSVWPIGTGIYFDSDDLPKSGVDYTNYYARFPGSFETRCLQIREYIIPVIPEVYNMSHVRFVTSSTDIQPNDNYEIWETYVGCENA